MAIRRIATLLLGLGAAAVAGAPWAMDFRSLSEPAAAYDAPSTKAKALFVVLSGTPVEVIVNLEGWSKVRDGTGDLFWIERQFLADTRTVIVRTDKGQVRAAADDSAALVFEAERDVVLEFIEAMPAGWIKVRHRDGQSGYIKTTQAWGL